MQDIPPASSTTQTLYLKLAILQPPLEGTESLDESYHVLTAAIRGYSLWVDVPEPDAGCQVIVKFPAATTLQACGTVVGAFEHATCQAMTFRDTFMMQSCCGSDDCKAAGVGKKMIRGMDWKRTAGATGVTLTFANGSVIEPLEIGNPPELNAKSKRAFEPAPLFVRDDPDTSDSSCTSWTPDSDLLKDYTRPADAVQIVATGVNGGTSGGTTTISTARTVEWSISVTTGVDLEIVKAETTIEFSQSITDTKTKTWTVPAGEVGKVGFTPTLRCSQGKQYVEKGDWVESDS